MFVKVLIGRYQGEIRDIAPEAARAMLKDGRAENAFPEPPAATAEAVAPVQRPERVVERVIEYEVEEHPWASEEGNAPRLPEREPATQPEPPAAAAEATPAPRRRRGARA